MGHRQGLLIRPYQNLDSETMFYITMSEIKVHELKREFVKSLKTIAQKKHHRLYSEMKKEFEKLIPERSDWICNFDEIYQLKSFLELTEEEVLIFVKEKNANVKFVLPN